MRYDKAYETVGSGLITEIFGTTGMYYGPIPEPPND